jgi:N-acetylmuramoyl-L-alanine amidase
LLLPKTKNSMKYKLSIVLTLIATISIFFGYSYIKKNYIISRGGLLKYERAEIYIQAGHEGRTKGSTGTSSKFGNEIDWTPIVADEATRILREAGISVIRTNADHRKYSVVDLALSIHFDGCAKTCATGASIGYDDPTDKPAAEEWKAFYSNYFKHKWHEDNFTKNLRYYYNYKYTITRDAELVLELGDLTCPTQAKWMKKNLNNLGHIVAYFAAKRIGKEHLITKPYTS